MERWKPDAVAIEEVFYSVNAKSALKLGQVRGVALLAAAMQKLPVAEYAPLKIKSSVVGYGLAKKKQVQFMVARLLELAELAAACRRRRCPGHRHLPHSYGADANSARAGNSETGIGINNPLSGRVLTRLFRARRCPKECRNTIGVDYVRRQVRWEGEYHEAH